MYCSVGVPYGYVAAGTTSGGGSERLGQTGTTYYAAASPSDFAAAAPVGVVSIPRGGTAGAPTSPPIRAAAGDQYVLQRVLHGQAASRGPAAAAGLLSLHDLGSTELGGTPSSPSV